MLAGFSWLHTSLATPIFHELLNCVETSSLRMAYLLTDVTTSQWEWTGLTAVGASLVAIYFFVCLLSTYASLLDWLQAWRTATQMAFKSAHMPALKFLLARTLACWLYLTTFYWRIEFCNAAWAIERISRIDSARFAEANVAEIVALMNSASESLVALN